jgi:hypothetical protein
VTAPRTASGAPPTGSPANLWISAAVVLRPRLRVPRTGWSGAAANLRPRPQRLKRSRSPAATRAAPSRPPLYLKRRAPAPRPARAGAALRGLAAASRGGVRGRCHWPRRPLHRGVQRHRHPVLRLRAASGRAQGCARPVIARSGGREPFIPSGSGVNATPEPWMVLPPQGLPPPRSRSARPTRACRSSPSPSAPAGRARRQSPLGQAGPALSLYRSIEPGLLSRSTVP